MEEMAWFIRHFTKQDQHAAYELIHDGLGEHFGFINRKCNPDLQNIWQTFIKRDSPFLVVEYKNKIIGTGALIKESKDTGRIVRMSVHKDFRRKGIARSLLQKLFAIAKEKGYKKLVAATTKTWHPAIRLYESAGFKKVSEDSEDIHFSLLIA